MWSILTTFLRVVWSKVSSYAIVAAIVATRSRKDYYKLKDMLPKASLDPKTQAIADDFGKYFDKHPTHTEIDFTTFIRASLRGIRG